MKSHVLLCVCVCCCCFFIYFITMLHMIMVIVYLCDDGSIGRKTDRISEWTRQAAVCRCKATSVPLYAHRSSVSSGDQQSVIEICVCLCAHFSCVLFCLIFPFLLNCISCVFCWWKATTNVHPFYMMRVKLPLHLSIFDVHIFYRHSIPIILQSLCTLVPAPVFFLLSPAILITIRWF